MSLPRQILLFACLLTLPALAQQPTRPAITGIAFAHFYTTDADAAQKFYGDTLGFQMMGANSTQYYFVNNSQWIQIQLYKSPPKTNVRFAAVAFTTTNATELEHYLESKDIKIDQPLLNGQFGVRDPEGNFVIFVQKGSNRSAATIKPSPNAVSTRIIHVGFIVRDRAKEDTFWQGILGFRPYWHGGMSNDKTDWISLQVPDGSDWIEYMLNAAPNPTLHQSGVMDHFSLGVTHMQDAVASLARNHCEGPNCSKTQIGRDGKVQLNLYDPDQTRVEFMEFTPTQQPCCSPFTAKHPTPGDPSQ